MPSFSCLHGTLFYEHITYISIAINGPSSFIVEALRVITEERYSYKWNEMFKSGLSKCFKGYLPQNLLGPLLNTSQTYD